MKEKKLKELAMNLINKSLKAGYVEGRKDALKLIYFKTRCWKRKSKKN